ncbi:restriction endonuclease subunit S, partial [Metamycoplasma auris]|uniref:restriction endonuclease subunit S n=1 Tax=Metamycoplasma auris TaxID=51363 RepID=UPI00058FEEA9
KINDNLVLQILKIYENWFIKFNFPNKNGKPFKINGGQFAFNELVNSEIPINWKIESLFKNGLSKILPSGINEFNNKKIYYETRKVQNLDIKYGEETTYNSRKSRANMQPIVNSVWFAKMKNSVKHLFVTENMHFMLNNGILSTGFCGLKCSDISFEYISSFILNPNFELQKNNISHGATQQSINNEDLINIKLIIPDDNTLLKYHRITKPLFSKITGIICENRILIELKDKLLPLLMNGQVTIED